MRMIQYTISDLAVSNSTGKRLSYIQCTVINFIGYSADIARFFEPAIKNIIKAIEEQTRKTTTRIRVRLEGSLMYHNQRLGVQGIFMVGGFATSDYLFSKLEDHFKLRGIDILRPDAYL